MGKGEGKEPLSGFQTVFRGTWVGGSLEVLQDPALWDQEKGDAKGGGCPSPHPLLPPDSSLTRFPLQPEKLCLHVLYMFK